MRKCLEIDEILQIIISYATQAGRVNLALTCRAFYDPAMDAVWHTLIGLQDLVHCLPAQALSIDKRNAIVGPFAQCYSVR